MTKPTPEEPVTIHKVAQSLRYTSAEGREVFVLHTQAEPTIIRVFDDKKYTCAVAPEAWQKAVQQINIPNIDAAQKLTWAPADDKPVTLKAPAKLLADVPCEKER